MSTSFRARDSLLTVSAGWEEAYLRDACDAQQDGMWFMSFVTLREQVKHFCVHYRHCGHSTSYQHGVIGELYNGRSGTAMQGRMWKWTAHPVDHVCSSSPDVFRFLLRIRILRTASSAEVLQVLSSWNVVTRGTSAKDPAVRQDSLSDEHNAMDNLDSNNLVLSANDS
jgi:hypothetical protein